MTTSHGFNKGEEPNRPIFSGGTIQSPPKIDTGFNSAFQTPANNETEEAKSSDEYDNENESESNSGRVPVLNQQQIAYDQRRQTNTDQRGKFDPSGI